MNAVNTMISRSTKKAHKKRPNDTQYLSQTWGATVSMFQELHYRKIMRRSDVLKILFVCVCVCHVCPAHPCGDNPLRLVDSFSRTRGLHPDNMLNIIKSSYPNDYARLMRDYELYLQCTQMVNTGYFKRSVPDQTRFDSDPISQFPQSGEGQDFMDMDKAMTTILDSTERQQRGLLENIMDSLSQSNENYSTEQFVDKEALPPAINRFLRNDSLSPLLKRIFQKYRTNTYDDLNTL